MSVCVHAFPSSHDVPSGCARFGGQSFALPVQRSSASHASADGRQTTAERQVHVRADSSFADAVAHLGDVAHAGARRHSAVLLPSTGHAASVPVQFLGDVADAARRSADGGSSGSNASGGQSSETPSQISATSQMPPLPTRRRALRVDRTVRVAPGARLGDVALSRGGAADRRPGCRVRGRTSRCRRRGRSCTGSRSSGHALPAARTDTSTSSSRRRRRCGRRTARRALEHARRRTSRPATPGEEDERDADREDPHRAEAYHW
jgi:hypothetical protein